MNTSLGATAVTLPVSKTVLRRVVYQTTLKKLAQEWKSGRANAADIRGLMNALSRTAAAGTAAEVPIKLALNDFLTHVQKTGAVSPKRAPLHNGSRRGFRRLPFAALQSAAHKSLLRTCRVT